MRTRAGVWIDHERARIAFPGDAGLTVVKAHIPSHPRFAHGGGHPGGDSSQGGESERRIEERNRNALDRYLDDVIAALGHPNAILVFGPGEAKQQLAHRLEQQTSRPRPTVTLETSDKLTDAQVVDKVTRHFGT